MPHKPKDHPGRWRSIRQLNGVQSNLTEAISACTGGAYVTLHLKTAYDLREIIRQAIKTEEGYKNMHLEDYKS
jgi:hypothetical protein